MRRATPRRSAAGCGALRAGGADGSVAEDKAVACMETPWRRPQRNEPRQTRPVVSAKTASGVRRRVGCAARALAESPLGRLGLRPIGGLARGPWPVSYTHLTHEIFSSEMLCLIPCPNLGKFADPPHCPCSHVRRPTSERMAMSASGLCNSFSLCTALLTLRFACFTTLSICLPMVFLLLLFFQL